MIISDKYKYIFLETPHTGSTAISKELIEKYSGRKILNKHANYHEFLKIASKKQKNYFVFAGVRNPLDEAASLYFKFLTDHKSNYTDPKKLLKNGGWVTQRKVEIYQMVQKNKSFSQFLRKFYERVYTSNININKEHCDFIIRFEGIDKDFSKVLKKIGTKQTRPLPIINKTKKRGQFDEYYDKTAQNYAVKIFGPFIEEWKYSFPAGWSNTEISTYRRYVYELNKIGRLTYSKYIKAGPLKKATFLRNILE